MTKFISYNIVGAVIWVFSLVSIGYAFGDNAQVKKYLDIIVIVIFAVTTLPVLYKVIRYRRS